MGIDRTRHGYIRRAPAHNAAIECLGSFYVCRRQLVPNEAAIGTAHVCHLPMPAKGYAVRIVTACPWLKLHGLVRAQRVVHLEPVARERIAVFGLPVSAIIRLKHSAVARIAYPIPLAMEQADWGNDHVATLLFPCLSTHYSCLLCSAGLRGGDRLSIPALSGRSTCLQAQSLRRRPTLSASRKSPCFIPVSRGRRFGPPSTSPRLVSSERTA